MSKNKLTETDIAIILKDFQVDLLRYGYGGRKSIPKDALLEILTLTLNHYHLPEEEKGLEVKA